MNGGRTHDFQESLNREIVDGILARCRNLQDLQDESSQTDNTGQTGTGEDGLAGSAGRDGGRSGGDTGTSASRTSGSSVATGRRSLGGGADGAVGEGRGDGAAVAAGRSTSRGSSTAMRGMLVAEAELKWQCMESIAYQVLQRTLLVVVTGRVMVQGQSVMVRVVGWRKLVSRRFFRGTCRFKS